MQDERLLPSMHFFQNSLLFAETNEIISTNTSKNDQKNYGKMQYQELICPGTEGTEPGRFSFLSLPCQKQSDCTRFLGKSYKCCTMSPTIRRQRCIQGVKKPKPEPPHECKYS